MNPAKLLVVSLMPKQVTQPPLLLHLVSVVAFCNCSALEVHSNLVSRHGLCSQILASSLGSVFPGDKSSLIKSFVITLFEAWPSCRLYVSDNTHLTQLSC